MPTRDEQDKTRFPFLPFYVDDWLSSDAVSGFTLEQEAVYLRLLMRQWKAADGQLPKDEKLLAGYSRLGKERWRKIGRPILQRCFVERASGLVNLKLREIWLRTREKSAKAKAAAEKRWDNERQGSLPDSEDD